jgi:hypothetical protein
LVLVYSRVLPSLKARHWRLLSVFSTVSLIALIGFTRIALGAHFLTDVLATILPSFLELSGSRFVICHEANAATHGFTCWRAPYHRSCSGGRGIGRKTRAESPERIGGG